MTLLERDAELDLLLDRLERAVTSSEGSVVLVSGEVGIGKTTLVRSFLGSSTSPRAPA